MTKAHFTTNQKDPLLTTKDAAQQLGVSLRTIQLWADAGKLSSGKTPGGHRRIRQSSVSAFSVEHGLMSPPKIANKDEITLKKKEILVCLSNYAKTVDWGKVLSSLGGMKSTWRITSNPYEAMLRAGTNQYDLIVVDLGCVDFSWEAAVASIAGMQVKAPWVGLTLDEQRLSGQTKEIFGMTYLREPTYQTKMMEQFITWNAQA